MNILFVSYCGVDGNSMPHIVGFAKGLVALEAGLKVTIAVPGSRLSDEDAGALAGEHSLHNQIARGRIRLTSHGEALNGLAGGDIYDVLHLWTPREITRRWLMDAAARWPQGGPWPATIVHLEDNEEAIGARDFGSRFAWEAAGSGAHPKVPPGLSHPRHYQELCALAEGATVIWESLVEFLPPTTPAMELLPTIDLEAFAPRAPDAELCEKLQLQPMTLEDLWNLRLGAGVREGSGEIIVCYNGNSTSANRHDMISLYTALHTLREEGWPIRLLRTGQDSTTAPFYADLKFDHTPWTTHLGFVDRRELPAIYSLAHLFIQPGAPDEFNRYRLPSKLPEYLASGGICVVPAANLGLRLRDGVEAFILQTGDQQELLTKVRGALLNPDSWETMRQRARRFAQDQFHPKRRCELLLAFYQQCLAGLRERQDPRGVNAGLAAVAGINPVRSGAKTRLDVYRELAIAQSAAGMLAAEVRELHQERAEKAEADAATAAELKQLRKQAAQAEKRDAQLEEITASRAWKVLGKPLMKLERRGQR